MAEARRPADYVDYRETALGILGRQDGPEAVRAFGLDELFADPDAATDLAPAYAFLEAQGYLAAVTPALGLVGLVGCLDPDAAPTLLGSALGTTRLVGVPGLTPGIAVAADLMGSGVVVLADPAPAVREPATPIADPYLAVVDIDRGDVTTLVPEEEMNGRRAAMLARTRLGAAAETLGVVDRMLDDALAYSRTRRQFGRAVSDFQALQHLLGWAATDRHQLATLLDIAVARSARVPVDPQLAQAVKAMAGRVLHAVAQTSIQVTGAIGFTWEYSLNRLHHRGLVLDQLAGSSADLIVEMGRQVRTEGVVPDLFGLADALG